jgi:AcrR family transcriptional regulator
MVTDGRRARRDRNRVAVIDAMLSLLDEGVIPPPTDAIAERAGVSVSSVFRYFDSLDDLQEQTVERHFERFAPHFEIPSIGAGSLDERIMALVDARLELYASIAPVARLARARAVEHARLADTLAEIRTRFAAQIRLHFAPEIARLGRHARDDLVGLVDTLTSFESWDLLRTIHGGSEATIRRAWTGGIGRLIGPST